MKCFKHVFPPLLLIGLTAGSVLPAGDLVVASDWPQFHCDSARSGNQPGARLTLPMQRVVAQRFPSPIYASPAVVADRVYVQDARGHVACIDALNNRVVWVASVGGVNNTSSPAVADGRVYVGSTAGTFHVLDAQCGKPVRSIEAPGGVITAPALAKDGVYFSTFNGKLTKIDRDGNLKWTFNGGLRSFVEIAARDGEVLFFAGSNMTAQYLYRLQDQGDCAVEMGKIRAPDQCCARGGPVFLDAQRFAFQSFDSEFGRLYLADSGTSRCAILEHDVHDGRQTLAARGNVIYRGDKSIDVTVKATAKSSAGLVWRADPAGLYDGGSHSSPALAKDYLVVGNELGLVHFLRLEGDEAVRKPQWQFKTSRAGEPNSAVSSSPAVVDGRVYFGGEDGILYGLGNGPEAPVVAVPISAARPTPRVVLKGSEWRTPGGDLGYSGVSDDVIVKPPFSVHWQTRIWSTHKAPMIVAESTVFSAGRLGNLTALDAETGEILWKTHHPGVESRPGPIYVDGKLVILRSQGGQGDAPYSSRSVCKGPRGEGLWCHEAASGRTLWRIPMPVRYHFNHDGLAADSGNVFVVQPGSEGNIEAVAFALESGKEVWRTVLPDLGFEKKSPPPQGHTIVKQPPAGLKLPPRFASAVSNGVLCISASDRGTAGLNPGTGAVLWSTAEVAISLRSRMAARDGVVVVFTPDGDRALDIATGRPLWTAKNTSRYCQALTEGYLRSQGKEEAQISAGCSYPVFANGIWYHHGCHMTGDIPMSGKKKTVNWRPPFLSRSCPTPSPAYGRLYYSANGEGIIYCFRNPDAD